MAYTTEEIKEQISLVNALKKAVIQSISTGGVIEFRQGPVWLRKASVKELTQARDKELNTLYRMESIA